MSDNSVEESIEESFEDFGDTFHSLTRNESHEETYQLEESLAQTQQSQKSSTSKGSIPPSPKKGKESVPPSPQQTKTPSKDKGLDQSVTSKVPSKTGSKEAVPKGSQPSQNESKVAESTANESTAKGKVPKLALTERGPWRSAGGPSSAKDHLMRSTDARLFNLRRPYTERIVIVRDPSPTFPSARKIPRGLQKKMEEEKQKEAGEDGSSATGSQQPSSPTEDKGRKHLLYAMPQRPSDAVWGEANREFRPYMRVKAEYTTPAGKKVVAFGQLLSGWEVPKTRLREGPHARPPIRDPPIRIPEAKAVTTLPLIEKERSEKYVRVMLHDGVEKTLPKSKVKDAAPMDIFR